VTGRPDDGWGRWMGMLDAGWFARERLGWRPDAQQARLLERCCSKTQRIAATKTNFVAMRNQFSELERRTEKLARDLDFVRITL
jgi:hypothetical protein